MMTSLMPADLYTGKLVRLTGPRPDDKEALARWSHDNDYMRNLNTNAARPRPVEYYAESDKDSQKKREANQFDFRVRTLVDDKLIGFTDLEMMWNHQHAWVAIGIGEPEYRSKGYGSDALRLTVN